VGTQPFQARIEWNSGAPPATEAGWTCVPGHGVRVLFNQHSLFGFCFQAPGLVAAGESVAPVSRDTILAAARAVAAGASCDALPASVLGLLAVDFQRGRVALATGLSGSRAWYYAATRRGLFVASRLAALRAAGVPFELDEDALPEYCSYRVVLPPRTLVRDVRRSVPGRVLAWPLRGPGTPRVLDWRPSAGAAPRDPDALLDGLEDALGRFLDETRDASRATLLSGGLDSSLVAALERGRDPAMTAVATSFAWAHAGEHEREYADSVARHLRVPLRVVPGDERAYLAGLVDAIASTGEPVDHLQAVMLHLCFGRFAADGGRVLLSGQQADCLFGNDLHEALFRRRHLLAALRWTGGTRAARALLGRFGVEHERRLLFGRGTGRDHASPHHVLWSIRRYVPASLVRAALGPRGMDPAAGFRRALEPWRDLPLLDRVTLASRLVSRGGDPWVLSAEAHGVRLLYPFADPRLVRLLFAVPWREKLREPKGLVRALLRRRGFPEPFLARPKLSFAFPFRYWALPGTLLQPLVDLAGARFDPALLASLQRPETGRAMLLWSLVNLDLWQRLVLEGAPPADLAAEVLDRYAARGRQGAPR